MAKDDFPELDRRRRRRVKKDRRVSRVTRIVFWTLYWGGLVGVGVGFGLMTVLSRGLPPVSGLETYEPSLPTKIFDRHGALITQFQVERRYLRPYSAFPPDLINATVSIEDERFYSHHGVDYEAILRAAWANVKAGRVVQGGSTLTQQLARDLFLTHERTYDRKIREALLAQKIEEAYTKEEILYFYLNQTYYGHNAYGAEAAALVYFDKHVEDLTVEECAVLAGLPRSPGRYSPYVNPEEALTRRNTVLDKMHELGYLPRDRYEAARAAPIKPAPVKRDPDRAPYFTEYVRRTLVRRYGSEQVFRAGLRVYTTLDLRHQALADETMAWGLARLEKNHGKKIARYDPNLKFKKLETGQVRYVRITEATKAVAICDLGGSISGTMDISPAEWSFPFKPSTVIKVGEEIPAKVVGVYPKKEKVLLALEQEPFLQCSMLVMDGPTGDILAMIGGADFNESKFNRSVQAKRQPGSSFKAFLYTAAIDNGFTPADVIMDAPFRIEADGVVWQPHNYSRGTSGPMTIRRAIEQSINIVAARVIDEVGVETVIDYAHRMGVKSELVPVYSLALGSSDVTLLDMVNGFATLANLGVHVEPRSIIRVEDRYGNVLEEFPVQREEVVPENTCTIMTNMLEGVLDRGTAGLVRRFGFRGRGAGKTGTTDGTADTWFIGYVPEGLVAGVWVGRDDHEPLGHTATGETYAVPIWGKFMSQALGERGEAQFELSDDIVSARICEESGLLATSKCTRALTESFLTGTIPTKFCDMHEPTPWEIRDIENSSSSGEVPPPF
ncbi:MAG: PBP1A family penicillin-binding protein [Candidatus Coatesbacteria bacterium]|nr:MAG: PBP1A family penicillin-binding protein [Candidatus Coatesbacteria bacterium]